MPGFLDGAGHHHALYHQRDVAIVCVIHASLMVRSKNNILSVRVIESWLGSRSDSVHHLSQAQYDMIPVLRNDAIMCAGTENLGATVAIIMVNLQNRKQDGTAGVMSTPQGCALHNCRHQPCSTAALTSNVIALILACRCLPRSLLGFTNRPEFHGLASTL
ncbi:hypothetical protein CVIRNUC_007475 [Coccomyxa viridis]|uniref:Uncharacterized protein n=1 Tax=Coccomyxa viridis TaxID=1274662 RepID=A0AAV1IBN2_9CHLO|nr:hypothetical protein CVIRNUC_007475 [Coccomyxa viridis]